MRHVSAITAFIIAIASFRLYFICNTSCAFIVAEQVATPPPVYTNDLDYFLPGRTINLYGYAPASGKFLIDLIPIYIGLYAGEQAICLRLEVDIDIYHITRNSLAHGTEWFDAEDEGYSGLLAGRFFSLSIIVQMYSYEIVVNGYHFATYQHRIPFTKVMRLQTDSHVRLEPYEYY